MIPTATGLAKAEDRERDERTKKELAQALSETDGKRRWIVRGAWFAAAVVFVAGGVIVRSRQKPAITAKYMTQEVTLGDVVEKVQASGIVQPVLQVNVGAQTNGRVTRVYVDYNAIVKRGDILAELDPTILGAQVTQQEAGLAAQKAQIVAVKADLDTLRIASERTQRLFDQNLASRADLDSVKGQFAAAKARVSAQEANLNATAAQLGASKTNVGFTRIVSPVDGTVITRTIDPGATVVASFQTPTLFVIAQDLRRMRIMADIDEADVGKLKEKMQAEAVVDAFPGEVFTGMIEQLRFSPNTVQGVVTYSAVIEVENPESKLRPGMTATVTVRTREVKATLRVPNAALRYKPSPPKGPDGKPVPQPPQEPLPKGQAKVFLLEKSLLGEESTKSLLVNVGITDGLVTAITESSLKEKTTVVTDELDAKKKGIF